MVRHHFFKRYAVAILASIVVVVGGGVFVRYALAPSIIVLPANDIGQIMFNSTDPADGWMIAHPRKTPRLYRSTDGGLNWHRVASHMPNRYQMILEAGKKTWVFVRAARHNSSLASFPNEWATVYFRTMQSAGTVEPIRATTRPKVPWASFETFMMPPQTSNAPWLLAESIWNPGTMMYTLFHWNATQARWVAVTPIPLGVRGDVSGPPGIMATGSHTLWWTSSGNGTLGQLDRVTIAHNRAKIQAANLPEVPLRSACPSGGTVLTERAFGVPAFSGPRGRVTVSWEGCHTRVHFGTWATTDGGRRWHRAGTLFSGAAGNQWASFSVGYAWSIPKGRYEEGSQQWWTTTDGGKHWIPTIRLPAQARNTLEVVTPQDLWVLAGNQLLHSADAGIHWTSVRTVNVVP